MYQLEEQKYFFYFIAVVVLLLGFILVSIWKKKKQKKFTDKRILELLSPEKSTFKPILKISTLALSLCFLVIALVNPKIGTKLKTVKRQGVDIVFALDVSRSMLAKDIAPSRLEKSKQLISKIIDKLGSDRVGIIIYAGSAYSLLPITTDHAAAKMFLQNANPDMVSSQGTAINEALKLGQSYFDDDEQTNRYLFVISDGEDHEESSEYVANEAVKQGIKIFTIGVGTTKGGPIPIERNGTLIGYKTDGKGDVVVTKMNDEKLKLIANEGNGEYMYGNNISKTVTYVDKLLLAADKKEFEAVQIADFKDQFQWFVALGLLFLILELLMTERKTKWVEKLNLFNEKKTK